VLLLRDSGLRLGDAVTLDRDRTDSNGHLFLRTAKTKVFVPMPSKVIKGWRLLFYGWFPPVDFCMAVADIYATDQTRE